MVEFHVHQAELALLLLNTVVLASVCIFIVVHSLQHRRWEERERETLAAMRAIAEQMLKESRRTK